MSHSENSQKNNSIAGNNSFLKILVCLLVSAAGLAIPLIYYMLNFSPVLTDDMLSEMSFVQYLCANNSHTFAEGWTSTREFAPFGLRFFLTFFYTSPEMWENALSSAVFTCYGIFSFAFLFFVYTLRVRHFPSYIICFLIAVFLGQFSLQGTYYCNNLITYLTYAFFILGLLMQGIRCRLKLPIAASIPLKIIISAICVVPVFLLNGYVRNLSANYSFKTVSLSVSELKKQFSIPLFSKPEEEADTAYIAGLEKYLETSGNSIIYCDTEITEKMYFISGGKYNTATVSSLDDLTGISSTDSPENFYGILSANTFPLYVAVSNKNLSKYENSKITLFADICYADDYFTVLRYDTADYYYDTALQTDIKSLKEEDYDTVFLSMYDISTFDSSEADTYMGWSSLFTTRVFTDMGYLNMYTDIIFEGNNDGMPDEEKNSAKDDITEADLNEKNSKDENTDSVSEENANEWTPHIRHCLIGVDPEILLHLADDDTDKMISLLDETFEKIVAENKYTEFIFIFPAYKASHYSEYSEKDYKLLCDSYQIFTDIFDEYDNVEYDYYGDEEWLYSDSYIFESGSDSALEYGVAYSVMGYFLAGYYRVDSDMLNERILSFADTIRDYNSGDTFSYDLADTSIVIVGDSIFGLFQNNSSIQAILSNYSGAYVDCRAIGGATASYENIKNTSLSHQFDVSDINEKLRNNGADNNRLVFIIEFGINDYFEGYPAVNKSVPYDEMSYSGAIRTTIETIKANWPESEILILSPGYIEGYEAGTRKVGDGFILQDYRDAAIALSEEYHTLLLDLTQIGITPDNLSKYTVDLLHYNEAGRMLIAREIVNILKTDNR